MFYKGYQIEPKRKQGDNSMFSRIVGYRAFYGLTLVWDGDSIRECKKWLKENPPSKLRKEGTIK